MNISGQEYGQKKLRELIVIFSIGTVGAGILLYLKTEIPILKIILMSCGLLIFWIMLFKLIWFMTKKRNKS